MNCKEIAGITDLICDKIKSKYPTMLNVVDKHLGIVKSLNQIIGVNP